MMVNIAVMLKSIDYDNYDYFIGMDSANIHNMRKILNHDKDNKIYKLLTFAGRSDDVADPWYTGDFAAAYTDIDKGCRALLKCLTDKK